MSEAIEIALCRSALAAGAPLRIHVRGTSMLPALWPGDSVSVESSQPDDLRPGQVVVFVRDGQLIVHRIVGIACDAPGLLTLTTRGDAQLHDDRPVPAAELLGVARTVRRFGNDRPMDSRPALAARGLAWIVNRSEMARFLLCRLHSGLSIRSRLAPSERTGP